MRLDDLPDETLLQRWLEGKDTAWEVLMRRHEDRIFALALRMTGNRSDALDATQDTFIAAFRHAASFRGDAAFGTWLYKLGMNACRDLLRKNRRLPGPTAELLEHPAEASAPSQVDETVSNRIDITRALGNLPEEYKGAVVLHDLCGVTYEEIAAIEGVPMGTVKSRISRGRKMLATELEQPAEKDASKRQR